MAAGYSARFPALTAAQVEQFERDGYLLIPDALDADTVAAMRSRIGELVGGFDASHVSVFSTKEQVRTSDAYFLESGDKVRYFFEENAFNADGTLKKPKELCINKVGHNLHQLEPVFRGVSFSPEIAGACRALGLKKPLVVQSMYIFKQPGIGGEVGPHQDGAFLYTRPQSVVGFWWALEECTTSNGCLWAVPGSHLPGATGGVARRFKRNAEGTGTEFEPKEPVPFDLTGAVPLECKAGTLVLLHHAVVHYSAENHSDRSRHAYSIHVVDGGRGFEYPADNWLQRTDGQEFEALYDAERDPDGAAASASASEAAAGGGGVEESKHDVGVVATTGEEGR